MTSRLIALFGGLMVLIVCIAISSMFEGVFLSSIMSLNGLLGLAFLALLSIYSVARIRTMLP